MTCITICSGRNVRGFFTRRNHTIMAARTGPTHFVMINLRCRCPAVFRMTTFTDIAGTNMLCTLASGRIAIMTGTPVSSHWCYDRYRSSLWSECDSIFYQGQQHRYDNCYSCPLPPDDQLGWPVSSCFYCDNSHR